MSSYLSDAEKAMLEEKRLQTEQLDKHIAKKNSALVGDPKEYKGITYSMNQRGLYECISIDRSSPLNGVFTSTSILHSLIDKLESNAGKASNVKTKNT